jgi:hypothetical protein
MVVNKTLVLVVAVALTAVAVGAGYVLLNNNTGSVSVLVTDDALDSFDSLNITFSQVALHRADEGNDSGWTTLNFGNRTIDLTHLSDNITSQVGFDRVAAGKYTQLRIIVGSAVGTLKTGAQVTVSVPSGELKTSTPFELKSGGSATIVLHINVHEAGGGYTLQPSLGSVNASP